MPNTKDTLKHYGYPEDIPDKSPKVCPLLKQHCLESSCAWYMQGCRRCAMLVMGEAGEIATTTAIIIPK